MSRRKKKDKIVGHFVALTYEMIESKAYQKLKGIALKVLILCLKKVKTHNHVERYSYQFKFTYPEAEDKGICESSFARALAQLIELGLIECVVKGGLRNDGKSPSYYKLSTRWKDYGTQSFIKRHNGFCESVHGQ